MDSRERLYFIYILRCADDTLYTGYTTDIEKRIETHNAWKWAKYTRWRLPAKLLYSESFDTENEAKRREYEIKQLTRKQKEYIIENPSK